MERIKVEKKDKAKRRKKNIKTVIRQLKHSTGTTDIEKETKRQKKIEREATLDQIMVGIRKLLAQNEDEVEETEEIHKEAQKRVAYVNAIIQDKKNIIRLSRDDDALIIQLKITKQDGSTR